MLFQVPHDFPLETSLLVTYLCGMEKNTALQDDFGDISFLDQSKLKKQEDKIEKGEIACSTDNPEECLSCGS